MYGLLRPYAAMHNFCACYCKKGRTRIIKHTTNNVTTLTHNDLPALPSALKTEKLTKKLGKDIDIKECMSEMSDNVTL